MTTLEAIATTLALAGVSLAAYAVGRYQEQRRQRDERAALQAERDRDAMALDNTCERMRRMQEEHTAEVQRLHKQLAVFAAMIATQMHDARKRRTIKASIAAGIWPTGTFQGRN